MHIAVLTFSRTVVDSRILRQVLALQEAGYRVSVVSPGRIDDRIATRVIWIEQGRLRADGTPADVIAQYAEHMSQVASGVVARLGNE